MRTPPLAWTPTAEHLRPLAQPGVVCVRRPRRKQPRRSPLHGEQRGTQQHLAGQPQRVRRGQSLPRRLRSDQHPWGERYEDATAEIARSVDEGALIVNYIGHGGERGWAHERILNMETIQAWTNLQSMPVFMTATCELFRFDDPELYSAGEAILFNPNGGGISLLTTTRTVYSSGNQQVNRAFFETVGRRSGQMPRGHLPRHQEFRPNHVPHQQPKLQLDGRPWLELAYPLPSTCSSRKFRTPCGRLDEVTVRGYVGNVQGDTLFDFNGVVVPTVFDKRASVTTLDNDASEGPVHLRSVPEHPAQGLGLSDGRRIRVQVCGAS